MSRDDGWKLMGYSLDQHIHKSEKALLRTIGMHNGLRFSAEQQADKVDTLTREKGELASHVKLLKKKADFSKEKCCLEAQVKTAMDDADGAKVQLADALKKVNLADHKIKAVEASRDTALKHVKELESSNMNLVVEMAKASGRAQTAEEEMVKLQSIMGAQNTRAAELHEQVMKMGADIEAIPSREEIIEGFKSSEDCGDFVKVAVDNFKRSEEYQDALLAAVDEYKLNEGAKLLSGLTVENFKKTNAYKELLIANGRKSMPHIMECARVLLKDDLSHLFSVFEAFFLNWVADIRAEKRARDEQAPPA